MPTPQTTTEPQPTTETSTPDGVRRSWRTSPPLARRLLVAIVLIVIWASYIKVEHVSKLEFSSPQATLAALWHGWINGDLRSATVTTLEVLLAGVGIGIVISVLFTLWATATVLGDDVVSLLTGLFNPIPSIAIVPLTIIWFGVSNKAVLFVIAESVIWPLTINLRNGIQSVNPTLAMVGRNIGLRRWSYARRVLLPSSLPQIISGLEIGWAAAWRTGIAAELVFGTAGGNGGIGFFINTNQNFLKTDAVFAGLATIGIIGVLVQIAFRTLERHTTARWGMTAPR